MGSSLSELSGFVLAVMPFLCRPLQHQPHRQEEAAVAVDAVVLAVVVAVVVFAGVVAAAAGAG